MIGVWYSFSLMWYLLGYDQVNFLVIISIDLYFHSYVTKDMQLPILSDQNVQCYVMSSMGRTKLCFSNLIERLCMMYEDINQYNVSFLSVMWRYQLCLITAVIWLCYIMTLTGNINMSFNLVTNFLIKFFKTNFPSEKLTYLCQKLVSWIR